jgi:predicted kinase
LRHAAYQTSLYILCGLPFAGKTTLARALAAQCGCAHIEIDAINTARGLGLAGAALTPTEWDETYRLAFEQLAAALRSGRSAISDAANYTRAQRDQLRALAADAGAASVTLSVDVAAEEARRRWLTNRAAGASQRNDVRDDDFQHVLDHFEPPAPDEGAIRIDGTTPLDDWLRQVP